MAFVIENIATLAEIPALVGSFATAAGWTVGAAPDPMFPDARLLTRPEGGAPLLIQRLGEGLAPGVDEDFLVFGAPSITTNIALMNNIRFGGTELIPQVAAPTRLFLFSGVEEGHAFIAGAVEFGFNRYRHFYLGGLVIKGNYTGGEIVAANTFENSTSTFRWPRDTASHKMLFQATGDLDLRTREQSGFAHVVHPDSADPIKPISSPFTAFSPFELNAIEGSAVGGPLDRLNDTFLRDGQEHFAAATILTPQNMYEATSEPRRWRPLGHVAGTRMVNITNLEPGQQVTVGSIDWRVFPEFRKSNVSSIDIIDGGFNADESSEFIGVAFAENLT